MRAGSCRLIRHNRRGQQRAHLLIMGRVQRQSGAAAVAMLVVVVVSVAAVAAVVVVVVVLAVVVVVVVVGRHQVPGEAGRAWAGRRRRISLASTDSNLRHTSRIYLAWQYLLT
jgi:hypothetical protein